MPRARTTRRRTGRTTRTARRTSAGRGQALKISLGIMGDGWHVECVEKGSTVKELFKQAGFELGDTVRLNGRIVSGDARLTQNNSTVTSTPSVNAGLI